MNGSVALIVPGVGAEFLAANGVTVAVLDGFRIFYRSKVWVRRTRRAQGSQMTVAIVAASNCCVSPTIAGGIMFSSAEKFEGQASETCQQKSDEALGCLQVAKFEPQELMQFLEFCAAKIHRERNSRKSLPASKRMK